MRIRERFRTLGVLFLPWGDPIDNAMGTVVTAGLMAAYADPPVDVGEVVAAVLATVVVYWLVHVYADMVGRLAAEGPAFSQRLRRALRSHWGLVRASFPLLAVMLVTWASGVDPTHAIGAGVWCAVLVLVAEGVWTARRRGARFRGLIATAVAAGLIGLALVVLKGSVD